MAPAWSTMWWPGEARIAAAMPAIDYRDLPEDPVRRQRIELAWVALPTAATLFGTGFLLGWQPLAVICFILFFLIAIPAVLLGTLQQVATVTISSAVNLLIVGVLLVVFVILAPKGIVGWIEDRQRARQKS